MPPIATPTLHIHQSRKRALVFGVSGRVGAALLRELVASPAYERIVAFDDLPIAYQHEKLETYCLTYDDLATFAPAMRGGNDVFCCLYNRFNAPDSGLPLVQLVVRYAAAIAELTAAQGAGQFLLLSTVTADQYGLLFLNRLRGQLEQLIRSQKFWAVHIFRPSLTLPDHRPADRLLLRLGAWLDQRTEGALANYRPVSTEVVAIAMLRAAQLPAQNGIFTYFNPDIEKLNQQWIL